MIYQLGMNGFWAATKNFPTDMMTNGDVRMKKCYALTKIKIRVGEL